MENAHEDIIECAMLCTNEVAMPDHSLAIGGSAASKQLK